MNELQEFIILNTELQEKENSDYVMWSHKSSLLLIDLYKQHKSRVGTLEIRNMKKLWEIVSEEINIKLKWNTTPANVENRWRVLERNFKKYMDNKNKTGRGRKNFEYAQHMEEIFQTKRNINPEILLSSDTVQKPVAELIQNVPEESCSEAIPSSSKSPPFSTRSDGQPKKRGIYKKEG
ncbi:myb/sant-like dna-binding domain [Holotrichia oblita]|uniref:Myb/sant-like dna-binding domain n=1 Tax=Holotrichia oblita TaxID=644536 RepID=A0ACB9TLR2_HOLOL|nr:myb/sant-like dna-binding domain [Holotrichia oblita]